MGPLVLAIALVFAVGCEGKSAGRAQEPGAVAAEPSRGTSSPPRFLPAGRGAVATLVRAANDDATVSGHRLIVYVGATWCEPCTAFHQAVDRGELDDALANLRLLEFDADVDAKRLADAGYESRLIPLFAVPGPDGRASGRQIEGGIKGAGAVSNILERLLPLADPGLR